MNDWTEEAIGYVQQFPRGEFLTEDVRAWAYENGLEEPHDHRAWGSVMLSAEKQGIVLSAGVKHIKSGRYYKTIWKKPDGANGRI